MHEISYSQALARGVNPLRYHKDAIDFLGVGRFQGTLDHLVWSKRSPSLLALITLDSGERVCSVAYQARRNSSRPDYLGYRDFAPGDRIVLDVQEGPRGGLWPLMVRP